MTIFPPAMMLSRTWLRYAALGHRPPGLHTDVTVEVERPTSGHGSTGHTVGRYGCYAPLGDMCHYGSILRLTAPDQEAVYVIREYDMYMDHWVASWPD